MTKLLNNVRFTPALGPPVDADVSTNMKARPVTSPLSARALAAIASRLAAAPTTVAPPGDGRRWERVAANDQYEAWVIAWPHGTGLPLHDHAGSTAGVAMVEGRLRERYLVDDALHTRWWTPGDLIALEADHAHEVLSLNGTQALSVHVYSPPLGEVRFRAEQQPS